MAATFEYNEDNGVATGTPAKGATRSTGVTQVNWKNTDDVATPYSSSPVAAGSNSYPKYQFGKFTGTFNQIGSGLWAHTAGVLGSGLTLVGKVTSTYETPSTAALTGAQDITAVTTIDNGLTVNFSTVGPEGSSPTSTLSAAGYTQYLVSQLQTDISAAAGDTATVTLTLQYNEN